MKPTRKPYGGTVRSLVIALDIGTTFSGVSYAILEPGEIPKIHGVTRFPGQEHVAGNSKIPSIMYYDRHGRMKAAGAEADGASVLAQAEDEGWIKVELFKLRLRPKTMVLKMNGMRLSSLPRGKKAVEVFGDFLSYLFQCTKSFIMDTHANGQALWRAVEHDLQLVLSHPNGWEGAQQTKMRTAAIHGGLIPDTDEGRARIRFVTEGEASLHACVLNGLAEDVLANPAGHGFIVADAGGGTLDISSYAIRGTSPLVIEEIAPPDCVFAGSVFVSRRARNFFEDKLKNSKYGTPDSLDHITKRFDETTKRLFRDIKETQFVHFGSPLDKDTNAGIRMGQLKLTGAEVAALFEPSIEAAVASIKAQIEASGGQIKSVWLVGGFAASPWLFSQLQEHLSPFGVAVSRPDTQTSKAVADGAIGFYCDHHVSARMSKFMYGVEYLREYDPKDDEHVARKNRLFELPSGPKLLPDAFDCILARGLKVKESTVFSRKYCTEVTNLSTLSVFEVEIWCYRGGNVTPKWILRNADNFSTLCYVRADLSPLAGSAQAKSGKGGKTYWTIVFSIEIHFGLTEFKARIKWTDNQKIKYGPASIVYNEGGHRAEDDDEPDMLPEDDTGIYSHPHSGTRSYVPSRAPSRDGYVSNSKYGTPSQPPVDFPKSPSRRQSMEFGRGDYERERRISAGRSRHESDNWRDRDVRTPTISTTNKGKEREIPPEAPRITEKDRGINISAKSNESKSSARTAKLGEELSSVWGAPAPALPSKPSTPIATPAAEIAAFDVITSREIKLPTPPEPKAPSEVARSHTPSKAPSKAPTEVATPHSPKQATSAWGASKAASVAASKPPTEVATSTHISKAASKIASRAGSIWGSKPPTEAPTPAPATKPASPVIATKSPTPRAITPPPPPAQEEPPVEPPREPTPPPPAPAPVSRPTSIWSKTGSTWGANLGSKAASPISVSKAGSKAGTPRSISKAASKAATPVVEKSDPIAAAPEPIADNGWGPDAAQTAHETFPLDPIPAPVEPPAPVSRPRSVFDDIYAEETKPASRPRSTIDDMYAVVDPPAAVTADITHNDQDNWPLTSDGGAPLHKDDFQWDNLDNAGGIPSLDNGGTGAGDAGFDNWDNGAGGDNWDAPVEQQEAPAPAPVPEEPKVEETKKKKKKKKAQEKEPEPEPEPAKEPEPEKVEEPAPTSASIFGGDQTLASSDRPKSLFGDNALSASLTGALGSALGWGMTDTGAKAQDGNDQPNRKSLFGDIGSSWGSGFGTSGDADTQAKDETADQPPKKSMFGDVGSGWGSGLGGWGATGTGIGGGTASKRTSGLGWGAGSAPSLFGFGVTGSSSEPPVVPEPPSAKPGASPNLNSIPLDDFPAVATRSLDLAPAHIDIPATSTPDVETPAETVPQTPADEVGGFETTGKKKKKKQTATQKKAEDEKKAAEEAARVREEEEAAEKERQAKEEEALRAEEEARRLDEEIAAEEAKKADEEAKEAEEAARKASEEAEAEQAKADAEAAEMARLEAEEKERAEREAEEEKAKAEKEAEEKAKAKEAEEKAKAEAPAAKAGGAKKKKKKK